MKERRQRANERLQNDLRRFAEPFETDFKRSDQSRWLLLYLQGLLADTDRKNVEGLTRGLVVPDDFGITDPTQALQNFINQSPWDEEKLWARYRRNLAGRATGPSIVVVEEVAFPKQGAHSVGVLRQYSREFRKKVNCQVAVTVNEVEDDHFLPLALRLYLPKTWLEDASRLKQADVPPQHTLFRTKAQIAGDLLQRISAEDPGDRIVVTGPNTTVAKDIREDLDRRNAWYLLEYPDDVPVFADASYRLTEIADADAAALDRHAPGAIVLRELTEQPCWQPAAGWISLPRARVRWLTLQRAAGLGTDVVHVLVHQPADEPPRFVLANVPTGTDIREIARWWELRSRIAPGYRKLREKLGLDHFEGRSWRGFHHHACLVMLAHGFLQQRG